MLFYVTNLDNGKRYGFVAESSYDAMAKMRYYLGLSKRDMSAKIRNTDSGKCYYMDYNNNTYSIVK